VAFRFTPSCFILTRIALDNHSEGSKIDLREAVLSQVKFRQRSSIPPVGSELIDDVLLMAGAKEHKGRHHPAALCMQIMHMQSTLYVH